MEHILINETTHTPEVTIDRKRKKIVVEGKSRLENPSIFFQEFNDLLEECLTQFNNQLVIDFKLTYINTSSSKWLFHTLKNLQVGLADKNSVMINWYYDEDDEAIFEAGETFLALLGLPFKLLET